MRRVPQSQHQGSTAGHAPMVPDHTLMVSTKNNAHSVSLIQLGAVLVASVPGIASNLIQEMPGTSPRTLMAIGNSRIERGRSFRPCRTFSRWWRRLLAGRAVGLSNWRAPPLFRTRRFRAWTPSSMAIYTLANTPRLPLMPTSTGEPMAHRPSNLTAWARSLPRTSESRSFRSAR